MTAAGRPSRPGLTGGILTVMAVALLLQWGGTVLLHEWQWRDRMGPAAQDRLAMLVEDAAARAQRLPMAARSAAMARASTRDVALNWVPATVTTDAGAAVPPLDRVRRRLSRRLGGDRLALTLLPRVDGIRDLMGTWRLGDGTFLTFRTGPFLGAPPTIERTLVLNLLLLLMLLGAALLTLRALARPLERLARAADEVGRGHRVAVPVAGPAEVRRVGIAFAAMQDRLVRLVEEHAQALAAVSHDLRTPIQRMRLRTAQAADPEVAMAMEADLVEMEGFIASILDYVAHDRSEARRPIDVVALLSSVVSDAAALGADIDYAGPSTLVAASRPIMLKRTISNLVDNARSHAAMVRITLDRGPHGFAIAVDDDGPGIAASLRAEAILPFRRLDPTRYAGAGLGLATAKRCAEALGAKLHLGDSDMGGLQASVIFDRSVLLWRD